MPARSRLAAQHPCAAAQRELREPSMPRAHIPMLPTGKEHGRASRTRNFGRRPLSKKRRLEANRNHGACSPPLQTATIGASPLVSCSPGRPPLGTRDTTAAEMAMQRLWAWEVGVWVSTMGRGTAPDPPAKCPNPPAIDRGVRIYKRRGEARRDEVIIHDSDRDSSRRPSEVPGNEADAGACEQRQERHTVVVMAVAALAWGTYVFGFSAGWVVAGSYSRAYFGIHQHQCRLLECGLGRRADGRKIMIG